MKRYIVIFVLLFLSFTVWLVCAQTDNRKNFKVVFYNVENFFDTENNPDTADEEYLSGGMRGWNYTKYNAKQTNIAKVIAAIGGWDPPALVGMCEVESEKCLTDLTKHSGLKSFGYEFAHFESPDARGIDVALLYQPSQFELLTKRAINVKFPNFPNTTTRDILYVSGLVPTNDTLHVFVCHYPSRLGGELESEVRRVNVATILRTHVDSIYTMSPTANILIMGDFNDYPDNRSMTETLKAKMPVESTSADPLQLYNMAYPLHLSGKGTYKYSGEWGMLDQMIVSGNLLQSASFSTSKNDIKIFDADFLLEDDATHLGKKPFRTYIGMRFNGGFSDHLPVMIDFWYE